MIGDEEVRLTIGRVERQALLSSKRGRNRQQTCQEDRPHLEEDPEVGMIRVAWLPPLYAVEDAVME